MDAFATSFILFLSSTMMMRLDDPCRMTGDAYLFDRLGGFSGGVLLAEPFLPASSLTRNTRNTGRGR